MTPAFVHFCPAFTADHETLVGAINATVISTTSSLLMPF